MTTRYILKKQNLISVLGVIQNPEAVLTIDASLNNITTLQQFQNFISLQELKLSYNFIFDLQQITFLSNLRNLKVLDMSFNPVSQNQEFRLFCSRVIPSISVLNTIPITPEEQIKASSFNFTTPIQFPIMQETLETPNNALDTSSPQMYQQIESENETPVQQEVQSMTQQVATLNPAKKTLKQSTSFQTPNKTKELPTLSAPNRTILPVKPTSAKKASTPKKSSNIPSKPPINPFKRPDAKQQAVKDQTQDKLVSSIITLLDLVDNAHMALILENVISRRK